MPEVKEEVKAEVKETAQIETLKSGAIVSDDVKVVVAGFDKINQKPFHARERVTELKLFKAVKDGVEAKINAYMIQEWRSKGWKVYVD